MESEGLNGVESEPATTTTLHGGLECVHEYERVRVEQKNIQAKYPMSRDFAPHIKL